MINNFWRYLIFCIAIVACKPEEPEDITGDLTPTPSLPIINGHGCFPQTVLAYNLNPLYTFKYSTLYPTVLEEYRTWDETSGNVLRSYRYVYNYDSLAGYGIIDSLIEYFGDYEYGDQYYTATSYFYHAEDLVAVMDSAEIYTYDPTQADEMSRKGTIYYDYNNDNSLLTEMSYIDNPENNFSSIYDNYFIDYNYDTQGRMIELRYHNYNDVETYYELHERSDYLQPNWQGVDNRQLAQANLYAPSQTIAHYSGTGTYTYNYVYQVNEKNYIVETSVIQQSGDTTLKKLFTYECFD